MTPSATMRFDGRTAIVTGGGRGIGRAHALTLAQRGASVVVDDVGVTPEGSGGDEGPAETVAEEIRAAGGRAVASFDSVDTVAGAEAVVAAALNAFGGVDVVVNNAGILTAHEVPASGPEDVQAHLDVHLLGSFNVTRAAWPHLAAHRRGSVVMTTSCGVFGSPVLLSYGAAKAGVIGLMRNFAVSGREAGIRVNAVAPYARTRMADPDLPTNRVARQDVVDEVQAAAFARLAPEYVAAVAVALAHESCAANGEIYTAGGGLVARMFLAETRGFAHAALTAEDVAASWAAIDDEHDYLVPADIVDYTAKFIQRVPTAAPAAGEPA